MSSRFDKYYIGNAFMQKSRTRKHGTVENVAYDHGICRAGGSGEPSLLTRQLNLRLVSRMQVFASILG